MAQLSRPYQIALGAVVLFALVWFVALNGHGSSSSSTPVASTPAPTPAPATAAKAKAAPGSTHIEGLTRAVTHAREAVAASQTASNKSANSSAEAPSHAASVTSSSTTTVTKHGAVHTSTTVVTKHSAAGASATVATKHPAAPAPHKVATGGIPPRQAAIESELKRGEVAIVLFWNPKGADDNVVYGELQTLLAAHHEGAVHPNKAQVSKLRRATGLELKKKIAVHYASAGQVASFGTFTKTIQVYGTPTILVINKSGAVTTINGLTDTLAIEQMIDEARQGS
jgi:hypothetical protein